MRKKTRSDAFCKSDAATTEAMGVRDTLMLAGLNGPAAFLQRLLNAIMALQVENDDYSRQIQQLSESDLRPEVARLKTENGRIAGELTQAKEKIGYLEDLQKQTKSEAETEVLRKVQYLDRVATRLQAGDIGVLHDRELAKIWSQVADSGLRLTMKVG